MASQSMKQQIHQSIVNSQVQQVMAQKREQEIAQLQASFDAWNKQQDEIANLQAQYDSWLAEQPQAQPVRQAAPESVGYVRPTTGVPDKNGVVSKQQIDYANMPGNQFDKEKAAETIAKKEEERRIKKGDMTSDIASVISGNVIPKLRDKNEPIERTPEWNKSVNDTLRALNSKEVKQANALADYNQYAVNKANEEKWLSPDYKLTKEDKEAAKKYAQEELQKLDYDSNKKPVLKSAEDRHHYADMVNLLNKSNSFTNAMAGYIQPAVGLGNAVRDASINLARKTTNLGNAITDTLGITNGAVDLNNEKIAALEDFYKQNAENVKQADLNAQTEIPLGYLGSNIAGQATLYKLSEPVFGAFAGAAGLSKAGNFALNQVGQNAQDFVINTIPKINEFKEDGFTPEEIKDIALGMGGDALGNLAFGVAGEGISAFKKNRAAKKAADAAFRANVMEGADKLAKLAGTEDVDNIVRSATRQSEEAAQNIENLASQIPKVDDYATDIYEGAKAYDVAKNVDENNRLKQSLIDDALKRIAEPIDNLEKSGALEGITNKTALKNYDRMKAAYQDYIDVLLKDNATYEEVEAAARELGNARKNFGRNMKNIDPEIAKQFDNMEYGELINQPLYNKMGTTKTPTQIEEELRAVYESEGRTPEEIDELIRQSRETGLDNGYDFGNASAMSQEEFEAGQKRLDDLMNGTYEPNKVMAEDTGIPKGTPEPDSFKTTIELEDTPENAPINKPSSNITPPDGMKVSKGRTNTFEKLGYGEDMPEEDYLYKVFSEEAQHSEKALRYGDSENVAADLLDKNINSFDAVDVKASMDEIADLMAKGDEDSVRLANRLGQKMTTAQREGARLVQASAEYTRNTPVGQLREAQDTINDAINKRMGKGTSEALDNLYQKISDIYDTATDKSEFLTEVQKLLKDKDLKEYVPPKVAMDMQSKKIRGLNKIIKMIDNAESLDKVPFDKIVDVMYKSNGGVALSAKAQYEIYNLLNEASKLDPSSYQFKVLQAKAARKVMAEVPSGLGDYIRAFLYDNMLGNFKTAFSRNFLGNVAYQTLEKVRELPSAGVDKLVSLGTGKHSALGWNMEKAGAYFKGFGKGAAEQTGDTFKYRVNTTRSGETGWKNALKNNTTVHNDNKLLGHWANQVDFYVENVMKYGDRPVYEANYAEFKTELEQMLKRYGKNGVAGLENVKDADIPKVIDKIAQARAADAVFQKQGNMSKGLTELRDGLGDLSRGTLGVDILSTASTPFTLTPGNMLEKAVEYTPIGALKNAAETAKELANGTFNQRRFVEEAGRTITGLPLLLGAYGAAKKGLINDGYSTDPDEKQAQKDDGFIEYGLNVPEIIPILGGKTLDTSDLPVYGPFMQAGSVIAEQGLTPQASLQAAEAVLGGSTTQGLRKAFGGDSSSYSSQDSIIENLKNTVLSSGSQLIPSLARQTAQTIDPYKRDLGEYGTLEYYWNLMKNSDPIGRQTLPIKYDVEGNPVLQNQGRNIVSKALENYLLPMNMSEYNPSPLNQEASRLLDATGNSAGFQPKAKRSDVKKWDEAAENIEYSEQQFRDYKEDLGKLNTSMGNALTESDFYNGLDDEKKVKYLGEAYSAMKNVARKNSTGQEAEDNYMKAYFEAGGGDKGIHAVIDLMQKNEAFKEYDVSKSAGSEAIYEDLGEEGLKTFSEIKHKLNGSTKSADIQKAINSTTLSKADKATMYSYFKPSASPGQNPYGYVAGTNYDPSDDQAYQKAKKEWSSLTPEKYYETKDKIDKDGNNSIKQQEMFDYLASQKNITEAQAQKICDALGGWKNKKGTKLKVYKDGDVWKGTYDY